MVDNGSNAQAPRQLRDGREWRIGGAAEVAWIAQATAPGPEITSAIPPTFAAYCTVSLPEAIEGAQQQHDRAVVRLLTRLTEPQAWWLGYLEIGIGGEELVFYDAPRVGLYQDWNYVVVHAGPEQALNWRQSEGPRAPWKGALPDLMFPTDHSWLLSTRWDDRFSCIGGSEALIATFANDLQLAAHTTAVSVRETLPDPQSRPPS